MKRLSLIIALVGIFSLFFYLRFSQPFVLVNENQISLLEDNQKTIIFGNMTGQKNYDENVIIMINKNISLNCDKPCPIMYVKNKELKVLAKYDSFYNSFNFEKELEERDK